MKIRIFALAKELGIENKTLIDYCNDAGIPVKSSALASISEEERDVVISYIESQKTQSTPSKGEKTLTPSRDQSHRTMGKVRQIPAGSPRPISDLKKPASPEAAEDPHTHSVGTAVAEDADEDAVDETPAEVTASSTSSTVSTPGDVDHDEPEVVEAEEAEAEPEPEATQPEQEVAPAPVKAEAPEPPPSAAPETLKPAAPETPKAPPAAKTPTKPESESPDPPKTGKLSREDYVSPAGTQRNMREMKPRANVTESDQRHPRRNTPPPSKSKPKTALPSMAAIPEFKAPVKKVPKAEEETAQRPDMKLTPELLKRQGPLSAQLQRHADKKKNPEDESAERKNKVKTKPGKPDTIEDEPAPKGEKRVRKGRGRNQNDIDLQTYDDADLRTTQSRMRNKRRERNVELKTSAVLEPPITVRSLSEAIGRPAKAIQSILFREGQMARINDTLDEDTAIMVAMELGVELEFKRKRDLEEELLDRLEDEGDPEHLAHRPPIVTILGHVDHGKTTLLDRIRSANVAAGEAGGITQHIAAYQVEHNGQKITFVDTPGHAAFGQMRARGANVTDIVVLVVAADDGVMPQTRESISHAKAAGVPMVVALNKYDLPDINEQRVLQSLAQEEVLPAEWGGEYEVIRTSATTGVGIDDLLETILLVSELNDFKADPAIPAHGVCLEAFQDEGRGAVAWLVVQEGTLRVGDVMLCGKAAGKIRAIYNDLGQEIEEAPPSTPVKVTGLNIVPGAGDHFFVMDDLDEARSVAEERAFRDRTKTLAAGGNRPQTLEEILAAARGGLIQELPLIIKADSPGSLEALKHELGKVEHPEVKISIIHEGVGGVNESDVSLAVAAGATIIAFHVIADNLAEQLAEQEGIEIRRFSIIYEIVDKIKRELEGLLLPEKVEVPTGRALVLATFSISRIGTIAGCRVLTGTIERSNKVHVIRDQRVLNTFSIASLKREKDDAKEVRDGMECGIRLEGFNDVKEGDLLEAFRVDEVKRTLD